MLFWVAPPAKGQRCRVIPSSGGLELPETTPVQHVSLVTEEAEAGTLPAFIATKCHNGRFLPLGLFNL
jgi:hypothetical protein